MGFELTVVTPAGEAFRGEADSVLLPGSEGDFCVLPNHERFLTPLRIGIGEIRTSAGETLIAALGEGFAEVTGEHVAVMVDSCHPAEEIDPAEAERRRVEAQAALDGVDREDAVRFAAYEKALELAHARVEVAGKS